MARAKRHQSDDEVGHDAFLDIVANLVGILVILIMVLGVRAQNAWQVSMADRETDDQATQRSAEHESTDAPLEPATDAIGSDELIATTNVSAPQPLPDFATPRALAESIRADAHEIDQHIEVVERNIALQKHRRDRLLLQVSEREQALSEQRVQLSQQELEAEKIKTELAAATTKLAHLQQQSTTYLSRSTEPETEIITHRPTPLAKKVLGEEEFFQLADRRIVHVPMNGFFDDLKDRLENQSWKLRNVESIADVLPPRDSFYMKYTFRRRKRLIDTPHGPRPGFGLEYRCLILAERRDLGEPVPVALKPGSAFRSRVEALNPQDVTIRVVVYPDCFSDFQQIKTFLWEQGFSISAQPLPNGNPIVISNSKYAVDAVAQ